MGDHKEGMDEEMKAKWTKKLTELGIAEEKIDEKLVWSVKKASHGLHKLRLVLDDKEVEAEKAEEIISKIVKHALEKDLSEIREWQEKRMEEREKGECCPHCHHCHHPEDHEEK